MMIPRMFGSKLLNKTRGTIGPRKFTANFWIQERLFSVSARRRANTLMETSGFSDTQLQVREAIAKICSNFPDVCLDSRLLRKRTNLLVGILGET